MWLLGCSCLARGSQASPSCSHRAVGPVSSAATSQRCKLRWRLAGRAHPQMAQWSAVAAQRPVESGTHAGGHSGRAVAQAGPRTQLAQAPAVVHVAAASASTRTVVLAMVVRRSEASTLSRAGTALGRARGRLVLAAPRLTRTTDATQAAVEVAAVLSTLRAAAARCQLVPAADTATVRVGLGREHREPAPVRPHHTRTEDRARASVAERDRVRERRLARTRPLALA